MVRAKSTTSKHVQMLVQLRPDQRAAIVEIAEERREPGRPPPLSEVTRELLDSGIAHVRRRPKRATDR